MEENEQLIADYLAGTLEAEARAAFERRLAAEPPLAAALRAQQLALDVLRAQARAAEKERLRALLAEAPAQGRPPRPLYRFAAWGAAAAAAMALLLLAWPGRSAGPALRELAQRQLEPYPLPVKRGDSSGTLPPHLLERYQEGRYAQVADSLRRYASLSPGNLPLALACADALSLSGDYAGALQLLESLPPDPLFQDAAGWRLALNRCLAGPPDSARPLLEAIAADPLHYRRAQAQALLQAMEKP